MNLTAVCDSIRALSNEQFEGQSSFPFAEVAKLVDALDLGSSVLRRESSSLSFRTIFFSQLVLELTDYEHNVRSP